MAVTNFVCSCVHVNRFGEFVYMQAVRSRLQTATVLAVASIWPLRLLIGALDHLPFSNFGLNSLVSLDASVQGTIGLLELGQSPWAPETTLRW